ncbi:hypothetical protein BGZ65_007665 [Modicella reniformis]|uniref:Uncharacterized protein n=1 Tax=Modicella reniformis TaxID=1440133 RepID=A0A9P6JHG3_9FUNG|nr:hypothetical protein BGZ65_007665 [Modicella reniformis]
MTKEAPRQPEFHSNTPAAIFREKARAPAAFKPVEAAIADVSKKRKFLLEDRDEAFAKKRTELVEETSGSSKLPKGIKLQTIAILKKESSVDGSFDVADLDKKLMDANANNTIWKEAVQTEFDDLRKWLWNDPRVLRPDIGEEDRQRIIDLVEKSQALITDDMEGLSVLLHKIVLQVRLDDYWKLLHIKFYNHTTRLTTRSSITDRRGNCLRGDIEE